MSSFTKNINPPAESSSTKHRRRTRGLTSMQGKGRRRDRRGSSEIGTRIETSENRCLRDSGITEERLEILATTDFKPTSSTGGNITPAGKMLNMRLLQRDSEIEQVKSTISQLQQDLPDEFAAALAQYESALTATEADIGLLKIMMLLRVYATHTARLQSFVGEYSEEDLSKFFNVSFLGRNTLQKLGFACGVNFSEVSENASQILAQISVAINACVSGLSPSFSRAKLQLLDSQLLAKYTYTNVTPQLNREKDFAFDIAKLSNDLTFSHEIVKIKNDSEADEELKGLVVEKLGESWINSPSPQSKTVSSRWTGTTDSTTSVYKKVDVSEIPQQLIKNILSYQKNTGVFDGIFYNNNVLPIETSNKTYIQSGKPQDFTPIDPLVDQAFSGEQVLNFDQFNEAIDTLVGNLDDLVAFNKIGFRILEKSLAGDGAPRSYPLVAESQPLSSMSIASLCLDVFDRRFASNIGTSLYAEVTDWMTPEHVAFMRNYAWLLMRDNPSLCVKIIDSFLEDYKNGFLTAAAQPAPIEGTAEIDDEGNEIPGTEEISQVQFVLPGTNTVVSLRGKITNANTNNKRIREYFRDSAEPYKPYRAWDTAASPGANGINQAISNPKIKVGHTWHSSSLIKWWGNSNQTEADGCDLRLIMPIAARITEHHRIEGENGETERYAYYGAKIIQAEIIDTYIEILRMLIDPFDPVEPAEEGDPVFPFIEGKIASPYTEGPWNWSEGGYEVFQMAYWVPTLLKFKEVFLRNSDTTYLYERNFYSSQGLTSSIVGAVSALMKPLDMIEMYTQKVEDAYIVPEAGAIWHKRYYPLCVAIGLKDTPAPSWASTAAVSTSPLTGPVSGIGGASPVDPPPPPPETPPPPGGLAPPVFIIEEEPEAVVGDGPFGKGTDGTDCRAFFRNDFKKVAKNILEQSSFPVSSGRVTKPADRVKNELAAMMNAAYQNEASHSYLIDFVDKFSNRVGGYRDTVLNLVEGEGTALGELITNLRAIGPAGEDVLQNISSNQMSLKQIAIEEESADSDNGYLPNFSKITDTEASVVKLLCDEKILRSPEGDTTKVIAVGIPAGAFDKKDVESEFALKVSYVDSEYPQLVFRPKSFKFNKDLYVLPEDFENVRLANNFAALVRSMKFSELQVRIIETGDATPVITLDDDLDKKRYNTRNPDIYINLAVSEALKVYYRIMLGINFSETSFLSSPDGIDLQISEASAGLAASMASNVEEIANFSEGLADNISSVLSDITKFDDPDSFVSGEITAVDESLLGNLKNSYQTRVFSPEVLRSRSLSAKMFDRIYLLPIDPDEFYVVAPGDTGASPDKENSDEDFSFPETPQEVFDFYLNAGIIEETGLPSPKAYKLAPRRSAEGSMALGRATVTMTTVPSEVERLLDL